MRRLTLPTDPEYCAYCRTPLGSTRYLLTGSTVRYCSNECLNKAINKSSNGKKEKINEDEDRS